MEKILVTGASGFLGRHLVDALLDAGYQVFALDLQTGSASHERLRWIEGSFLEPAVVKGAIEGVDAIYHLASTTLPKTSNENPQFDVSSNLQGTLALLDSAVACGVKKVIYISSGGTVYGVPRDLPVSESHATEPACSYGIVKLTVEKYLALYYQLHGLESCSLRLSNPYGEFQRPDSGQGAIAAFVHKALHGEPIEIWGDGSVVRDFIYVKDAVRAMLLALDAECAGVPINIGYGSGFSLNEVIAQIEETAQVAVERDYRPGRDFDVPAIYLDIEKAKQLLAWQPEVTLAQGLGHLVRWARQAP